MLQSVLPLSLIISLRFLGLFIVLPTLSLYAIEQESSTEFLVGVVVGGYALTQMLFQVPFGILSDRIGRKKTILIGLIIFGVGSIISAFSENIYMLILGRFLQGSGAIGAVVSAMISDVVKEEQRAKAMAIMGGSIAGSFALSMLLGPLIGGYFGVDKLFLFTTFLVIVAIAILIFKSPNPPKVIHLFDDNLQKRKISAIFRDLDLIRMNITNLLQKALMTLTFLIAPLIFTQEFNWEKSELVKLYLPALILGVLAMAPSAILSEKRGRYREVLISGVVMFAIAYLLIGFSDSENILILAIAIFFIGFNIHEPIMQSLTSKLALSSERGVALGIFNSFGYFGTFIGGVFGAIYLKEMEFFNLSIVIVAISIGWIFLLATMQNPAKRKNLYLKLNEINSEKLSKLNSLDGVIEYYINQSEETLIVKYSGELIDEKLIKSEILK